MGLLRNLTVAVGRAALDVLAKGDDQDPRKKKPEDDQEAAPQQDGDAAKPAAAAAQPPGQEAEDPGEGEEVQGEVVNALSGQQPGQPGAAMVAKPRTLEQLEEALQDPKSLFWDPFAIVDALGYKDKPTSLTYQTLNNMVWRTPIIQAIIKTRLAQISNFAVPQVDKFSTGYRISLRDKKQKPTPASEQRSQQLERFILTTGVTDNPSGRDNFETFLQKYFRDSLTYDQACFEVVPSRNGKPAAFYAVDGATIRYADTTRLFVNPEDKDVARFVQIYDGLVVAEYTSDELSFGVRNPTANIRNQLYGQSELEMLVNIVTAQLWAMDYNQKFFSQGSNIKGIINFKGAIPEKQLRAFRSHWYGMTAGIANAFKTPIVNADDMQVVNMQANNKDMEFSAWFDFLIKISTSIYLMDPMEVNFKYGDSGATKAMFESANQGKLISSKDRGLKPLLRFAASKIDNSLIMRLDPDFVFEFVGLEASSQSEQADLNTKLVKSIKTVNEARAEEDMPPLPDGDVILDPVYAQLMGARKMQEQQAQQMQQQAESGDQMDFGQGDDQDGPPGDQGGDDVKDGPPGAPADQGPPSPYAKLAGKSAPPQPGPPAKGPPKGPPKDVEKSRRLLLAEGTRLRKAAQPVKVPEVVIDVEV